MIKKLTKIHGARGKMKKTNKRAAETVSERNMVGKNLENVDPGMR